MEQKKKEIFRRDDLIEDMQHYARKLKSLGGIFEVLSWQLDHECGDPETLRWYGEDLGAIIMDYAEALETLLEENENSFIDREKNIVFPIAETLEAYEWLSKAPRDEFLTEVHLGKLNEFLSKEITPVFDLRLKFEELLKEKMSRIKAATDTARTASVAKTNNGQARVS